MTLKENSFFSLSLDNSFEWDLQGFEPDQLFRHLIIQERNVVLSGKTVEQPKSALGFGLKKKTSETDEAQNNSLIIDLPNPILTEELVQQYKEFYHLRSFDQPYVFVLGLGSIVKDRKKEIVFCIPVELVLLTPAFDQDEINEPIEHPFGIRWTGDLPFYNETAVTWINEFNKKLPAIPDVLSDISLSNLIHDLTYQLDEGTQLKFKQDIYFSRVRFNAVADDENLSEPENKGFSFFEIENKHSQKITTKSLSTLYAAVESPESHIKLKVADDEYAPFIHNLAFNKAQDHTVLIAFRSKQLLERFEQLYGNHRGIFSFHHLKIRQDFVSNALEKIEFIPEKTDLPNDYGMINEAVTRLEEYDTALNSPFYDGSWSPSEIMGMVMNSKIDCDYKPDLLEIKDVTPVVLNQRKQLLKQVLKIQSQLIPNPIWDDTNPNKEFDELDEELESIGKQYESTAEKINELKDKINKITGITVPEDEFRLLSFIERLEILENPPSFERHQIDMNWHPLPSVITNAINLLEQTRVLLKKDLDPYFHSQILAEPVEELLQIIEPLSTSPKRFIDWNYMQHTKRLLGYAKNPNQKFDYSFLRSIKDLVKIKKTLAELNEIGKKTSEYLGSYWQGLDTDLDYLRKQISWLEAISKLKYDFQDQNIEELKKLIIRKDTSRAIRAVKDFQELMRQRRNFIYQLEKLLNLRTLSLSNEIDKSEKSFQEFIEELRISMSYIRQKKMLNRLKDSDHARNFENFVNFSIQNSIDTNDIADIYEFVILRSTLEQIEADRPILKHVETSDLKILIEIVTDFYSGLIEKTQSEFIDYLLETRQNPSARKKIKDITHLLSRFTETSRIPHYVSLFKSTKDAISVTHPILMCSIEQLEYVYPNLSNVCLITDFPVKTEFLQESTLYYKVETEIKKPNYPPILYKRSVPKLKQKKGKSDTGVLKELFKTKEILPVLWVFNSEKAEKAFWTNLTLDRSTVHDFLNASISLVTVSEKNLDSITDRHFASVVANYSFIDPKINPFALKKSSPKVLQENAEKISAIADYIYVISNEGEKDDDIKKRITYLESATKWSFHETSLLKQQLEKATFLNDTYVYSIPDSLLNGFLRFKDKRLAYIWSDATQNQDNRLIEMIINSVCYAYPIYNPIRKLYKKTDTLLFDALAFTKNEPQKRILKIEDKLELKPQVSQEDIEDIDAVLNMEEPSEQQSEKESAEPKQSLVKPKVRSELVSSSSNSNSNPSPTPKPVANTDIFATTPIPSEFSFNKIETTSTKSIKPKLNKLPRIKFFMPHPIAILGNPDEFFTTTARSIKKVILEIVKNESPIHWYRLTTLLADSWKMDSLNDNCILITKKLLTELQQQNELFIKEGVVYDNPSYTFTIRSRSGLSEFNSEEIPMVELEMALFLVLDQYYPISYEDLIKAASHLLGFPDVSHSMETVLKRALFKMGMEQIVSITEVGYQLTRPTFL